jgi:hypothetical protein
VEEGRQGVVAGACQVVGGRVAAVVQQVAVVGAAGGTAAQGNLSVLDTPGQVQQQQGCRTTAWPAAAMQTSQQGSHPQASARHQQHPPQPTSSLLLGS